MLFALGKDDVGHCTCYEEVAHIVVVLTHLPLQTLLRKSDYTSRIAKWGTMLGDYDVKYMPYTAVKGTSLGGLCCGVY